MSNPFQSAFASPSTAGSSLLVPGVPGMRIKVLALHAMSTLAQTIQLLDRAVFAAINVTSADSIQFTFNLTLPAGG